MKWTLGLNFGRSEKGTKFEKIFHFQFDVTQRRQILSGSFFQILCLSQKVHTLLRDHHILRQQKDWLGGSSKHQVLLT